MTICTFVQVLRKARVMQKPKTLEHTLAERGVLESIKNSPFLVNLRYAFQSDAKLHLVMGLFSFFPFFYSFIRRLRAWW